MIEIQNQSDRQIFVEFMGPRIIFGYAATVYP
jgi:hypothetical protein